MKWHCLPGSFSGKFFCVKRLYLNSFDGGIEVLNVGAKPNLNTQPWVYLLKLGDRAIWTKWRPLWFEFLLWRLDPWTPLPHNIIQMVYLGHSQTVFGLSVFSSAARRAARKMKSSFTISVSISWLPTMRRVLNQEPVWTTFPEHMSHPEEKGIVILSISILSNSIEYKHLPWARNDLQSPSAHPDSVFNENYCKQISDQSNL